MMQVLTDEQIDQAADAVMQGHEFRSVRRRVLEQIPEVDADKGFLRDIMQWTGDLLDSVFDAIGTFLRWIVRSLFSDSSAPSAIDSGDSLFGAGLEGLSQLIVILAIIIVLLIVIMIAARVVRSMDQGRRRSPGLFPDGEESLSHLAVPPGELSAATYEARALQMAGEGNFRGAIRELLLGSMSWIERSGLIRYRRGLTNRDYVRSVWRKTDQRDAFMATAIEFERVYFGRRVATDQMYQSCLNHFQRAFREEEQPVTTV